MAMNRIERIDKEIAKTREKITEYPVSYTHLEYNKDEVQKNRVPSGLCG